MHRFFVPHEWIGGKEALLKGDVARQIARVLRLGPGDVIGLLDNSGYEHHVRLTLVTEREAAGTVVERVPAAGEPGIALTLYQGLLKGEKMEWVLQKGTELGVSSFVPVVCQRSVPRPGVDWWDRHKERWSRIVQEAAEQSGRGKLPAIHPPVALPEACAGLQGLALLPWEEEKRLTLEQALAPWRAQPPPAVHLFVGPEGGFAREEVELARSQGAIVITLGRRILRAETAALAAVTAVLYGLGEMDR